MTDLIRRADAIEAVQKKLQDWVGYAFEDYRRGLYEAQDIIEALPSAETTGALDDAIAKYVADGLMELPSAEAVQGEWVRKEKEYNDCDGHCFVYWYECDQCGARPPKDQWKNEWHSNFCPNCGAKMSKGGDSE